MEVVADARAQPVLFRLREIMIEKPISQISWLEKPLSASSAAPGLPLVTPVTATRGDGDHRDRADRHRLADDAMMVPINSASNCERWAQRPPARE